MKRKTGKMIGLLTGMSMTALMSVGCGAEQTDQAEMVTVTFMNGDEELGSVETEAGNPLTADSYTDYESAGDDFEGWFETPTYLEASEVDLSTASFEKDTVLYGMFKSDEVAEDSRKWYIVGTSETGALATTNWAADISDDDKVLFELQKTDNLNEYTITLDLCAGDQFQVIADWSWDTQLGFGYVTECDSSQVENGGGLSGSDKTSNINVLQDGNYTITIVTNPDDMAQTQFTIVRNGD